MRCFSILTTLAVVLACQRGGDDNDKQAPSEAGESGVQRLVPHYLAAGDTLAADEIGGLQAAASKLQQAASSRDGDGALEKIVAGAKGMQQGTELEPARAAFAEASEGMIEVLVAHPEQREGLMVVHCPMAFDGEGGNWVQKKGKVSNPYEGSAMPTCGEKVAWSEVASP